MSLYRVKQFYWSLISKMDSKDKDFVENILNDNEKQLFNKLATYEQKHCINVAQDVLRICKEDEISNEVLIKVALLHDIGKVCKTLNPIEKSLMVMIDSISKGKLKRLNSLKSVDVYYNHAEKGYNILKDIGNYNERFLYLIKNHHNNSIVGDRELDILKACDSRN